MKTYLKTFQLSREKPMPWKTLYGSEIENILFFVRGDAAEKRSGKASGKKREHQNTQRFKMIPLHTATTDIGVYAAQNRLPQGPTKRRLQRLSTGDRACRRYGVGYGDVWCLAHLHPLQLAVDIRGSHAVVCRGGTETMPNQDS